MTDGGDEMRWYIDALDADGGIAFASFRHADTEDCGHVVLMRAPYFTPEPVAAQAVALGAIHIGAQTGVIVEGNELGFDSLEQVAEFVRRSYIAGGTSRGDPAPPAPDQPGPDSEGGGDGGRPPFDWPRYEANGSLGELAERFATWLTTAEATALDGDARMLRGYRSGYAAFARRAITSLIEAIVTRAPERPFYDEFSHEWQAWFEAVEHLRLLAREIPVADDEADYKLSLAVYRSAIRMKDGRRQAVMAWLSDNSIATIGELTVRTIVSDIWVSPLSDWLGLRYSYRHVRGRRLRGREVFRALASIPVPAELAIHGDGAERETVADFLARACATGCVGIDSPTGVSLVIFAAHCIVTASDPGGYIADPYDWPVRGDATLGRTMDWIRAQFAGELRSDAMQWVVGTREKQLKTASRSTSGARDE